MKRHNIFKKLVALAMGITMMTTLFQGKIKANAAGELTGLSSMEVVSMMGKGFNIGNTLDAEGGKFHDIVGHETSWGNPQINKDLIDGLAAAGFKTVRIPTTWFRHIHATDGTYDIDVDFLERVKEVVDWCYDNDMFVILNVHHESWVNVKDLDTSYVKVGEELSRVWSQIADYFADYDQHLIFEGMNEPRAKGTDYEWNGTQACYDAVNYLDQIFVDAVRSNGKGHNGERALMVPGYAASSSTNVLNSIVLPKTNGVQDPNLIVSTHCYSPYEFCLTDSKKDFNPMSNGDTAAITQLMRDLNSLFISNGVPVVIGECGCTNSSDNIDAREAWFDYIGKITAENGIPAVVWDNGAGGKSGGECHKYFNRKTGEVLEPRLVTAFIYGKQVIAEDTIIDFEPKKSGDETVIKTPYDLGFTSAKLSSQAKINHTEGATLGFALKVDSYVNREALYDLSVFKGKEIRFVAYLSSKEPNTVSVSYVSGGNSYSEISNISTTEDWTLVGGDFVVGDNDYISFKGSADSAFYVDDMGIYLKDENGNCAFEFDGSEGNSIIPADIADTPDETLSVEDTVAKPDDIETKPENKKSGNVLGAVGIISAVVVVIAAALAFLLKKKIKKDSGRSVMFCPKCGDNLREGASFCDKCGYKLNSKAVSDKRPFLVGIIICLVAIIILLAVIIFAKPKNESEVNSSTKNEVTIKEKDSGVQKSESSVSVKNDQDKGAVENKGSEDKKNSVNADELFEDVSAQLVLPSLESFSKGRMTIESYEYSKLEGCYVCKFDAGTDTAVINCIAEYKDCLANYDLSLISTLSKSDGTYSYTAYTFQYNGSAGIERDTINYDDCGDCTICFCVGIDDGEASIIAYVPEGVTFEITKDKMKNSY